MKEVWKQRAWMTYLLGEGGGSVRGRGQGAGLCMVRQEKGIPMKMSSCWGSGGGGEAIKINCTDYGKK